MKNQIKNNKIFWLIVALVIIILVTAVLFAFMFKNINKNKQGNGTSFSYVVPGVPYFGIYNHIGSNTEISGYSNGDYESSILSILEYWEPSQNNNSASYYGLIRNSYENSALSPTNSADSVEVVSGQNFATRKVQLSLSDLKKYINPEVKTPLLLFLPVFVDQPDSAQRYLATVLIGVNEKDQRVTFHNFWLGNNYEISFDEFNKLEEKLPDNLRNSYTVIQPKNLNEKLTEISQRKMETYPMRTSIMQKGGDMFKDYALGSGWAYRKGYWPQALDYLSKVENSPNFEDFFPPYFKTMLYYQKANLFFLKDDLDNALVYAQKAVAIDVDLDKPFKDWPGYEISHVRPDKKGVAPEPYIILGDILDRKGDLNGALNAYEKASGLMLQSSDSVRVDASIRNVELEMAKKGIIE